MRPRERANGRPSVAMSRSSPGRRSTTFSTRWAGCMFGRTLSRGSDRHGRVLPVSLSAEAADVMEPISSTDGWRFRRLGRPLRGLRLISQTVNRSRIVWIRLQIEDGHSAGGPRLFDTGKADSDVQD